MSASCTCIDVVGAQLETQGLELATSLGIDPETLDFTHTATNVVVRRIDGNTRKKIMPLRANYCPFCGVKYAVAP